MSNFELVIGPDPIFKKTSEPVTEFNDDVRLVCDALRNLLYTEHAVGVAAPMIGVLKRIIVIDLQENDVRSPFLMVNPIIIEKSKDMQNFEEGSICFPGISAKVSRPGSIRVEYTDEFGERKEMDATGYLATVIQHEIDYLDGVLYFDYLSPVKRNMLLKKAKKIKRDI